MGRTVVSFLVLVAFLYAGALLEWLTRVPIPGSVLGMALLTLGLRARLLPVSLVRPAAELLIRHMALLFVAPGVGLMLYTGLLREEWPALLVAGAGATVAVLLTVGLLQSRLERR